jgi:hypothetical protein
METHFWLSQVKIWNSLWLRPAFSKPKCMKIHKNKTKFKWVVPRIKNCKNVVNWKTKLWRKTKIQHKFNQIWAKKANVPKTLKANAQESTKRARSSRRALKLKKTMKS